MKKLFAIILTLCLVLSLAACGKTEPTEAPTEAPTEESVVMSPAVGETDGNVYTNTVLGITAEMGDDWTVLNEQEIAELYGYALDGFTDENLKSTMENAGSLIVYYAAHNEGLQNVNISMVNASLFSALEGAEDQVVAAMLPQLEQQLPGTGITVESIEATTVEFAGQEHAGISIVGSLNDVGIYEKQVIIISGDYLFVVTAASYLEDNCDALLTNFTALAE